MFWSSYSYNYSCSCWHDNKKEKESYRGFYYPQKTFLGGLDFEDFCTHERFPYDSEQAKSSFNRVPCLHKYIENISADLKTREQVVLGSVALSICGFFSNNAIAMPSLLGLTVIISLILYSFINYEDALNNSFSLLEEVNDCCCK